MNRIFAPVDQSRANLSERRTELLQRLRSQVSRQSRALQPRLRNTGESVAYAPVSHAQRRLWFIDQLAGVSRAAYHIPMALELCGVLNQGALCRALDVLVQRHEVLRTVFINIEGDAQQKISAVGAFALRSIDLSASGEAEQARELLRHKTEEGESLFDLRAGPLIRGRLIRLAADRHLLLVTMHHIISDGWSIGIFTRELSELYSAECESRAHRLPPLTLQYADYAQWQRDAIQHGARERQLVWWREHLEGAPAQLELPTDRPRPAAPSFRSRQVDVWLDAELTANLERFAQAQGMTLFMLLYAGWTILLMRLSGQQEVVVGTPVANRPRPELEGLIGFFLNTLALRVEIATETTIHDLLTQVKEVTLGGYDHQDVPFDQVVEALQPERRIGRNPLFQVMLALQNTPPGQPDWAGLQVAEDNGVNGYSMFDLLLLLEGQRGGLAGRLEYAADLFEQDTVERWLGCFQQLLKQIPRAGQTRVVDVPMLPEGERRLVLEQLNDTAAPYPGHKLIHQLFEEQALRTPGAQAVECEGQSLSYADLNGRANQLAYHLRANGAAVGERVAVCLSRGPELIIALLGVLKAGAAYVPLDPAYPAERLAHMLCDSAPRMILTHAATQAAVHEATQHLTPAPATIDLGSHCGLWDTSPDNNPDARAWGLASNQLAYIIYTSGSTGRPKGITVAHAPVINLIDWVNRTFAVGSTDTLLFVTSVCFDLSVYDIFGILAGGGKIRVATEALVNDPEGLARVLLQENITFWDSAPAALQLLVPYLRAPTARVAPLRLVFNSGDWIPLGLPGTIASAFPNARFISLGGATEATVWSNWYEVQGLQPNWTSIPYGRPIQNARYYILNAGLQPLPRGVEGDLYIAGDCLADGYTDPDLTRERFIPSPFRCNERLYKTGDRARHFADGNMEFRGRADFQVKIRGFRIELGEIESRLLEHPVIREAIVLAREDEPGDKRLVAYYTTTGTSEVTTETLKHHLSQTLPAYMVPSAYVLLPGLPITRNGKLDRKALPAPDAQAYGAGDYEEPQGGLEIELARIWREVLQIERVGRNDNFFQLGGHSLLGMRLIAKVAVELAVELTVITIFRSPTVRLMAAAIQSLPPPAMNLTLGPRQQTGPAPLTFAQLFRWHSLCAQEQRFRQLVRATRLSGPLDVEHLRTSVARIVARHEALRTQIFVADGQLWQNTTELHSYELPVIELTAPSRAPKTGNGVEPDPAHGIDPTQGIDPAQGTDLANGTDPAHSTDSASPTDAHIQHHISQLILEPVTLDIGPLFGMRLLRLSTTEHVLVVALHFMIADGYSMNVLMREILTAYAQLAAGQPITLPIKPLQLADYASWQHQTLQSWKQQHGAYWQQRLSDTDRLVFPRHTSRQAPDRQDYASAAGAAGGASAASAAGGAIAATVPFDLPPDLTGELRSWCRSQQTTIVLGVFTAFAALVLRTCASTDGVIRFQTNGRSDTALYDTVGALASVLNLRVRLLAEDSLIDLLSRVTSEHHTALEHADASFLDAQDPRPQITYNSTFNWVPREVRSELSALQNDSRALSVSLVPFFNPLDGQFDTEDEPSILLTDTGDRIAGDVYFSLGRHSRAAMNTFSQHLTRLIRIMVTNGTTRVQDIPLE